MNGVELEYLDEGTGVPVVFSHGGGLDLRYWEPQREVFAARYRFVAYSHCFHGTGSWPAQGDYSADAYAADLVAIIRRLEAGPVHFVGFSTAIALRATLHEVGLVRSLTIIEPNVTWLLEGNPEGEASLHGGATRTNAFGPRQKATTSSVPSCGLSSSTTRDPEHSMPSLRLSAGCGSTTSRRGDPRSRCRRL